MNDDRLRQILREGDPAAQDAGLTPDEVHALRRTVLTTIPESRRRLGGLPLLAAGTAALFLLVLVLVLGPWRRPPLAAPPPRMAAVPSPAPVPPPPLSPAAVPSPEPAKRSRPSHRRAVRAPQDPPARHEAEAPMTLASLSETPEPATREVRFSTPGGTRVIWELPVDGSR